VSVFGDDDPEDAWDEGDTVSENLVVLEPWMTAIDTELDGPSTDRAGHGSRRRWSLSAR
jgi:hypothetical protein